MSRKRQNYKHEVVEATSIPLRDGGFTVNFNLEQSTGSYRDVTYFESGQHFETEEAALEAGIKLGQHKIDAGYTTDAPVVNG